MTQYSRTSRRHPGVRRLAFPALAIATLALTAQAAFAVVDQQKPTFKAEAQRSPTGARIALMGKGWAPATRIKLTASRPPGASAQQDFGMATADSTGAFLVNKTVPCTTESDGSQEKVIFMAADSAGTKLTHTMNGSAWQCM